MGYPLALAFQSAATIVAPLNIRSSVLLCMYDIKALVSLKHQGLKDVLA